MNNFLLYYNCNYKLQLLLSLAIISLGLLGINKHFSMIEKKIFRCGAQADKFWCISCGSAAASKALGLIG